MNLEPPEAPDWAQTELYKLVELGEENAVFGYDDGRYNRLVGLGLAEPCPGYPRWYQITQAGRDELANRDPWDES